MKGLVETIGTIEIYPIKLKRSIDIQTDTWLSSDSVHFDQDMIAHFTASCRALDISYLELPSGADHDASHLAEIAPTGMLFIPCKDGRSHYPEEWSEFKHIGRGIEVLARTISSIDKEY